MNQSENRIFNLAVLLFCGIAAPMMLALFLQDREARRISEASLEPLSFERWEPPLSPQATPSLKFHAGPGPVESISAVPTVE